jgi:8-oxo-dGTP diphosphatase
MIVIAKKYKYAVIATDVAIFTVENGRLKVLLMKMKKRPYLGFWALPGGLIKLNESPQDAAKRHLYDKSGVRGVYLEQLYTFGKVNRDPFGRVVSVAYMALVPYADIVGKVARGGIDTKLFSVESLPKLAYDHREMIKYAADRLKSKLEYTNVVYSLLPKEFTLGELQKIYEIILWRKLDKRNFRKKLLALKMVKKLRKRKVGQANRPAELFGFTSRYPQTMNML